MTRIESYLRVCVESLNRFPLLFAALVMDVAGNLYGTTHTYFRTAV